MEIQRDRAQHTLHLSQKKYATGLVSKFGLSDAKSQSVPLSPSVKQSRASGVPLTNEPYAELVGGLMYLATCTRPDIALSVGTLARYMSNPMSDHWKAAKSVLRYVASTVDLGIRFSRGSSTSVVAYCDADYAGDPDTRKSTSGNVFLMHGGVISWSSRLQPTVAMSTAEAEFISAAFAVKESLWLKKLLSELRVPCATMPIMCDNQGAIKLLKHAIASMRSKHIDVQYLFAREHVARGNVSFHYCSTESMIADCMTKPLPEKKFVFCRVGMGVVP